MGNGASDIHAERLPVAGAGWVGYQGWILHPDVTMPPVGYAMMAAGIVLSLLVGCGLMALGSAVGAWPARE